MSLDEAEARELIVELGRRPRHRGRPDRFTHEGVAEHPMKGDRLQLYLTLEEGRLSNLWFEASSSAAALASASLLTSELEGLSPEEALALSVRFRSMIQGETVELSEMLAIFEGFTQFPSRHGCVLLVWDALENALAG